LQNVPVKCSVRRYAEAAQATEPAALIPLRWLRPGGTVVLVGDPRQLAPTVVGRCKCVLFAYDTYKTFLQVELRSPHSLCNATGFGKPLPSNINPGGLKTRLSHATLRRYTALSRGAAAHRLARSMFERLQSAGARVHLLSVQYRMHPEIRAFPSDRFYGGALVDGCGAAERHAAGRCTLTPFDPYLNELKGTWFQPLRTSQVKNRFQNVPFKCNLHRYNAAHHLGVANCGPYVAFDVAGGVERRGGLGASLSNAAEAGNFTRCIHGTYSSKAPGFNPPCTHHVRNWFFKFCSFKSFSYRYATAELAAAAYAHLQKSAAAAAAAAADRDGESLPPPIMTVGVVTPYRDQMTELRRRFASLLARADARFAPVEFATVDGVQGREFDAVILSCVRAPSSNQRQQQQHGRSSARGGGASGEMHDQGGLASSAADAAAHSRRTIGFLGDPRRLNVALTRPRRTLIVLGHAATLRGADRMWAALWDDADRRGVSVVAEHPFGNLFAAAAAGGGGEGGARSVSRRQSGGGASGTTRSIAASPPPRVAAQAQASSVRRTPPVAPVAPRAARTIDLTMDDDDLDNLDDDDPPLLPPPKRAKKQHPPSCTAEELTRLVRAAAAAASGPTTTPPRAAIAALATLERTAVTVALLAETQAGRTVKKLSKQPGVGEAVAAAAAAVVVAWKKMVTSE
jgi:hypothetical protein